MTWPAQGRTGQDVKRPGGNCLGKDLHWTGGSGANDYLYASTSDSTWSAMDIITNFHTAADVIDLTGLGTTLKYAGKLSGGSLSGHSVGWQVSGGNTFVYANTSSSTERLSATNMKIDLQGSLSLSSVNIAHL